MNKLQLLDEWRRIIVESDALLHALSKVVGAHDCPLRDNIYTIQCAYTRTLAPLVGDEHGWLEWYAFDNEMGKRGLTARPKAGKALRRIITTKQLLDLIEGSK